MTAASKDGSREAVATRARRLGAAVLYGSTSLMIMAANKLVLTSWNFPSSNVLAFGQFVFTVVAMLSLHAAGTLRIQMPSRQLVLATAPLSILFLGDVLCSLAATKILSMPMFTVLRRFAIPFTMILERLLQQSDPPFLVQFSVWAMVLGAILAAYNDLGFNVVGYSFVLTGDVITAVRGCLMKHALTGKSQSLDKPNLVFYNGLFSALLMLPILANSGTELRAAWEYEHWYSPGFLFFLVLAVSLGLVLQFAIALCTQVNSALTTTVVGCLKNVASTYMGMVFGSDYIYTPLNFAGVSIGVAFSVVYSYATFRVRGAPSPTPPTTANAKEADARQEA